MTGIAHELQVSALLDEAREMIEQVREWRRYLHQHPEVAFVERETAHYIREVLHRIPGLIVTNPTVTSTMARLVGGAPGRTIAVRADIDALPIHEENDVPYRSLNDGVMHACGHDGHTSIALGLATLLAKHREQLAGEVRFFFQHAEEVAPGGAEAMVHQGVMNGVDAIIGIHLWATTPVGRIGIVSGPAMAAPDVFEITIVGRGGHAAIPQDTIDPIAIGAQVVTALQHIVSRGIDPFDPVVVSVTQFHAGNTHNVIPGSATLNGTVRTFDAALRQRVPETMERIIRGICEAHGATYEFNIERGYRPVVNDPAICARLEKVVERTFGPDVLTPTRPTMGGEDFSAYLQKAPGVFAFVGAGAVGDTAPFPHHHPRFNIDESSLDIGLRYLTAATLELLS